MKASVKLRYLVTMPKTLSSLLMIPISMFNLYKGVCKFATYFVKTYKGKVNYCCNKLECVEKYPLKEELSNPNIIYLNTCNPIHIRKGSIVPCVSKSTSLIKFPSEEDLELNEEMTEESSSKLPIPRLINVNLNITIFALSPENRLIILRIFIVDTAQTVRIQLARKIDLPCSKFRLMYGTKILQDPKPLLDYNVVEGSTVFCSISLFPFRTPSIWPKIKMIPLKILV